MDAVWRLAADGENANPKRLHSQNYYKLLECMGEDFMASQFKWLVAS